MPALEVDQMRNGILIRVIDEQNNARHVIQTNIVSPAALDVSEPNRNHRFNRKIVIGDAIRIADKDIVVVNSSNRQPQTVMKTTRFR